MSQGSGPPALSAAEHRLGRLAALLAVLYALAGLTAALAPRLAYAAASLGHGSYVSAQLRFFALLSSGGLLACAALSLQVARAPREKRHAFSPLLLGQASTAAFSLLAWLRGPPGALQGPYRAVPVLALAGSVLWLLSFLIWQRAASGVNPVAARGAPPDEPSASAPVKLGTGLQPKPMPPDPKAIPPGPKQG